MKLWTFRILALSFSIAFFIGCISIQETKADDTPSIAFDNYPPYHYWKDGTPTGLNIDLIDEVFRRLKFSPQFNRSSWKRSLLDLEQGDITALCAGMKTPAREKFSIYPSRYLSLENNWVITLADSSFSISGIDDLKGLSVGTVEGYSYGALFDSFSGLDKHESKDDSLLLQLLLEKRVDVIVGNDLVIQYIAKQFGAARKLKYQLKLSEDPLYLIFSHSKSNQVLSDMVTKTLDKMVTDGTYAKILSKYRLESDKDISAIQENITTITVAADEWCPYNCAPDSDSPGYVIELLERIFSEHGIAVKYITLPWKRTLEDTRTGSLNAVVGVVRKEAPELIFPKAEFGLYKAVFFTKESTWKFAGKESLKDMVFGVAHGYSYGQAIDNLIQSGDLQVEIATGDTPLESNMGKLLYGRIQGIVADKNVFRYVADQKGISDSFYYGGSLTSGVPLYVAFSPHLESSKDYSKMWTDGLIRLRQTGELAILLSKYGLADWK